MRATCVARHIVICVSLCLHSNSPVGSSHGEFLDSAAVKGIRALWASALPSLELI